MSRLRKFLFSLSAVAILAVVSATAHADPITLVGVGSGSFSTASVDCVFDSATNTFMFTITYIAPDTTRFDLDHHRHWL